MSKIDLDKKFALVSDLKADDIRCKIKCVNKKGEVTYITVYNIKGVRRQELVNEFTELLGEGEPNIEEFTSIYTTMILEFTDLVLDVADVEFLLNDGTLTSKQLLHEFNEMIYELQYEIAINQLANIRNMSLALIAETGLQEMKLTEEHIQKVMKTRKNNRKKPVRRKFIK